MEPTLEKIISYLSDNISNTDVLFDRTNPYIDTPEMKALLGLYTFLPSPPYPNHREMWTDTYFMFFSLDAEVTLEINNNINDFLDKHQLIPKLDLQAKTITFTPIAKTLYFKPNGTDKLDRFHFVENPNGPDTIYFVSSGANNSDIQLYKPLPAEIVYQVWGKAFIREAISKGEINSFERCLKNSPSKTKEDATRCFMQYTFDMVQTETELKDSILRMDCLLSNIQPHKDLIDSSLSLGLAFEHASTFIKSHDVSITSESLPSLDLS